MERRDFLKLGGVAVGSWMLSPLAQAQEHDTSGHDWQGAVTIKATADVDNLNVGMQRVLGKNLEELTPTDIITIAAEDFVDNGDKVPVSITVARPPTDIKTLHAFVDTNPDPYMHVMSFTPKGALKDEKLSSLAILSVIRIAADSPVRVVAEMEDGQLLVASLPVNIGAGGCA